MSVGVTTPELMVTVVLAEVPLHAPDVATVLRMVYVPSLVLWYWTVPLDAPAKASEVLPLTQIVKIAGDSAPAIGAVTVRVAAGVSTLLRYWHRPLPWPSQQRRKRPAWSFSACR